LKSQTSYKILLEKEANLESLPSLAEDILTIIGKDAIVLLNGDLAAGKTTLVNQFTKNLKLNSASSPTFSLQQIYSEKLFHYDFYRVNFEEIANLGLIDELEKSGLHFIEWAMDDLVNILVDAGFKIYSLNITATKSGRKYILRELNA